MTYAVWMEVPGSSVGKTPWSCIAKGLSETAAKELEAKALFRVSVQEERNEVR